MTVPAPRRSRADQRSLTDELVLLAQAVDVLAVRVAVSGGLASGVRARALGLHLASACSAVREHALVQRDVVLPVLAAADDDAAFAALRTTAEHVLATTAGVVTGATALLEQAAGVGALQELGIATRALWSAAVEHERAWGSLAAPRARQLLVERRRDIAAG